MPLLSHWPPTMAKRDTPVTRSFIGVGCDPSDMDVNGYCDLIQEKAACDRPVH